MPTLAEARHRKSLTQQQLADQLGVALAVVSAWERGAARPTVSDLNKLCQIIDVSPEEIELASPPDRSTSDSDERRREIEDYNERMGYMDYTVLRGGRYDVDPAFHEPPETR